MKQENIDSAAPTQFLTYRLARVQIKLNMQAARVLETHCQLTLAQWRVLVYVAQEGKITAAQLSRETGMDKGLISRNVKSLVEKKLLKSTLDRRDTRVHLLTATKAGNAVYDQMLPIMRKRQAGLTFDLRDDEIDALHVALDKIEAAAERTDF